MLIFERAIGFLAPPVCISCGAEGRSLCINCAAGIQPYGERCFRCGALSKDYRACQSCRRSGSPSRVIVSTIHDGLARDLLHAYKFEQQRATANSIARIMASTYKNSSPQDSNYLVVPVPTATKRVRERGFDHSTLLAKKLAALLNLNVVCPIKRIGQSRQVGSARTARLKQLDGAFRINNHQSVYGQKILLVDDVVTTGATLTAASKTLRQAGAKRVDALVFAKRL